MQKQYTLPLFLIGIMTLCGLSNCKEDIEPDNSDKKFPVTLRMTKIDESVRFDWDIADVSGFQGYFLVRSTEPIETGRMPSSFQIIFTDNNRDSTFFIDDSQPLVNRLYYKLYVKLGTRFVESETQSVELNNFLVAGQPNSINYYPDSNWLVITNSGGGSISKIEVIDFVNKRVLATKSNIPLTNIDYTGSCIGRNTNDKLEYYYWPSNSNFFSYSLPDLTEKQAISSSLTAFSLVSNDKGLLFSTQYDYDNSFTTRRGTDFSIVRGIYRSNYYEHRTLMMLDPATNLVLESGPYSLMSYNVNSTTGTLSNVVTKSTNYYYTLPQEMVRSHDKKYIIPQRDGKIYDLSLDLYKEIPTTGNASIPYQDYAFSKDDKFVYTLSQSPFFFNASVIQKFSFPEMEFINSKEIENVSASRLFSAPDGGIIFIGAQVNNQLQYTIKKYNF